ncbi:MAG: DNA gyrase/topoisomerase IV subunit A [Acidobacteria bacterium]|nr:DNA gyrase/topoisomerase IV subunit A [Acidobacteriota bacterium]
MEFDAENGFESEGSNGEIKSTQRIEELFGGWFLDYASYVILERAVPALLDGLKPVQRRLLHAMKTMDDGRFHKAANIIGQTMQYHPHGDAAIGEALINLGQKELLVDTQGNWGDIRTGDGAAAPRYIEAKLSKFALEVVFNPQTTTWQRSYDGRKNEPVHLPVKFPLVLAQGVEGIAVGLATKIMPHNFLELIDASIAILEGKNVHIVPDFPTGGLMDAGNYNDGLKGGRLRVRARIDIEDKRTLVIREIPYSTTTTSLMESIVKANDNGKIKIKRVVDNTAQKIEVIIELPGGVSPEVTLDALYAFTDCEVSISPNSCVIHNDQPVFMSVSDKLRYSTHNTLALLRWELEIRRHELAEKWHFSSLEKLFIEERIYRDIEECETWEAVLAAIDRGLAPHKPKLRREVTREDIIRLTEIKIKRISRYDSFKADEAIRELEQEMAEVEHHLAHLVPYAVDYFRALREKYGKGRERRTEIRSFENIEVTQVAVANEKLYVNRADGFVGYGLKKDEYVCDCSDLDDIIVFLEDGRFMVTRVSEKAFVGKDIIYVHVWNKNNRRMIYHLVYRDGSSGPSYVKRFAVTSITRDRHYDLTQGTQKSRVLYFSANPNSEAEVVTVTLSSKCRAHCKVFDYDFAELAIKGRSSKGNRLTKYPVQRIDRKSLGTSTLGGREIWYDDAIGRLNTDSRGRLLGTFEGEDLILTLNRDGHYELTTYELTNHYDPDKLLVIEKYDPATVVTAVHYDAEKENYFVKRFQIETLSVNKPFRFIGEDAGSRLVAVTTRPDPVAEVVYLKGRARERLTQTLPLADQVDVRGWKALGNRLWHLRVEEVRLLPPDEAAAEASIEAAAADDGAGDAEKKAPAGGTGRSTPGSTTPGQRGAAIADGAGKGNGGVPAGDGSSRQRMLFELDD